LRGYSKDTIELDLHVDRSPDLSAPCGSAAERFGKVLADLGQLRRQS
jgi:hypothetical protein